MTSKTVAQLLAELGVEKSLSRPYNSNENPYWEAQFKTMKYRPTYPGRFGSPEDAKAWTGRFLHWYNHSHYHTGLALMVPAGQEKAVRAARQQVLKEAYARHPERFARGVPPKNVWINKPPDPDTYRRQTSQSGIDAGSIQPQGSNLDLQSPNCSLIEIQKTVTKTLTHTVLNDVL